MVSVLGPKDVGYIDILNHSTTQYLEQQQKDGTGFNKTPIRPSSAGKCARELYHEMMQYSGRAKYNVEVKTPEVHRLLDLGSPIEWHVIKQFEKYFKMAQIRYKQQVLDFGRIEAVNDKNLSQHLEGSIDLCLWSDEWKCVIDVKSKKDKFSSYRGTKWDEETEKLSKMKSVHVISEAAFWVEDLEAFLAELRDPFFEANFRQLNLYCVSDFLRKRGIDHGAIIQYCKNDSRLREIRFKPSDVVAKQVFDKFKGVVRAVDENKPELAPKEYSLGSMKCAFCPFSKQCWNEDTLKAWFSTFKKKQWPTDLVRLGDTGDLLEAMLVELDTLGKGESLADVMREKALRLMVDNQLVKIKRANGEVFEAKHLKSPYPHFELRRSKA